MLQMKDNKIPIYLMTKQIHASGTQLNEIDISSKMTDLHIEINIAAY